MTAPELISLCASIASLVLSILAICLSIVFFRMSNEASKETKSASKDVSSAVERLEKLFDKLYSDTFSIMKDTVSDMRKHIWYDPTGASESGEVSDSIKSEISSQISRVLEDENVRGGDNREEITKELERVFENAIKNQETNRHKVGERRVLSAIEAIGPVKLSQLAAFLEVSEKDLAVPMLFELRRKKMITWDNDENTLNSDDVIASIPNKSDADPER